MRIVLGERAHAHETVQRARRLVTVHLAELGITDGQITVAAQALAEDLHMAGAVHRLDGVDTVVGCLRREHVLAELLPMPGGLPETAVHEFRPADLLEADGLLLVAHVADQRLEDAPALGMPEHRARGFFLHVEEIEFAADAPMVTLLGLLEAHEVIFEILLVGPRGAVDALQHLVARIAAPIGTGDLHQLEDLEFARRGDMRAATQIHPASLAVEADGLVRGDAGDDLGLVVLAQPFEERHGLIARHLATLDPQISLGEFAHLRLDGGEVLGRERTLVGEVVIEAVFDDRTDGDLRLGEERLRRLREQMRGRVADDL